MYSLRMPPSAVAVMPSTEKGEETREHLLDLASAAFARDGYGGTSLNAVIRSSGLTKGAFYYYFPSKVELARAVCEREREGFRDSVLAAIAPSARAVDELIGVVDAILAHKRERPMADALQKICRELGREPELASLFPSIYEPWIALVAGLIRRAQSEGDVPAEIDADPSAHIIVCAFTGVEQSLEGASDDEI